jgi:hypothetical protein
MASPHGSKTTNREITAVSAHNLFEQSPGSFILSQGGKIDDLDKLPSLFAGEALRRSTSSLGDIP